MTVSWPRDLTLTAQAQPVAATIGQQVLLGPMAYRGTIASVSYIPAGSATGASGDNRSFTLYNRSTGAGTASVATLPLTSGNNMTDNVPLVIPLVAGAGVVERGDVLEWHSTAQSAGMTDPGGLVIVTFSLRS